MAKAIVWVTRYLSNRWSFGVIEAVGYYDDKGRFHCQRSPGVWYSPRKSDVFTTRHEAAQRVAHHSKAYDDAIKRAKEPGMESVSMYELLVESNT